MNYIQKCSLWGVKISVNWQYTELLVWSFKIGREDDLAAYAASALQQTFIKPLGFSGTHLRSLSFQTRKQVWMEWLCNLIFLSQIEP